MLALGTFIVAPQLKAAPITADRAKELAKDFFAASPAQRLATDGALKLEQTVSSNVGKASYYVFNAADGKGFVIVAADDAVEPILGYSYTNTFASNKVPAAAGAMLAQVARHIDAGQELAPRRFSAPMRRAASRTLATPEWNQTAPFNNQIPGKRLTGCVGLATAIIMKYHQHPAQGTGSAGGVDFNVNYDWNNMPMGNGIGFSSEQATAVSTLINHAAHAILTDFGQSASSAFEVRVPSALINHFGYDAGVSFKKRSELSREEWDGIIINEIDNGRPVLYSGQDVSSGHAFVCDGYEWRGNVPYFNINWGWGGLANGFFASDALNPVGSRAHSYNDQTTIIYNIKPARTVARWSAIHLTSDEQQPGLTIDVENLTCGGSFSLRAGALKNIENNGFSGKIAPALVDAQGNVRTLLATAKSLSVGMLQHEKYMDFACTVPADITIDSGDKVRMVTQANGSSEWLPVAGDLITIGEVPAQGNVIPTFDINFPATVPAGAVLTADRNTVIKGRDYTFKVESTSSDNIVTVKANGFLLTADANGRYRIPNVTAKQDIRIVVQRAADVVSKRNLYVTAGKLSSLISDTEAGTVKDLTLFGSINASDFYFIRDGLNLERLDISGVEIVAKGSEAANAIPTQAFQNCRTLRSIILPSSVASFGHRAFEFCGIESIEIPSSLSKMELNVFRGCYGLHTVTVRRRQPIYISWCVFSGDPKTKLVVPVGCAGAYASKENWKDFKSIVEENPVAASSYNVCFSEAPSVKFTPITEGSTVAPNGEYSFRVDTDDKMGDAILEVYANRDRLMPDANGVYTATVRANTIIYSNFRMPQAMGSSSPWSFTGALKGAGMASEVINVAPGKSFTIRANAVFIPQSNANNKYAAVLTDAKGNLKEVISNVVNNDSWNCGDKVLTFTCNVREASVREGNNIRIATSMDGKVWSMVRSNTRGVCDSLRAIGNPVVYHTVTTPPVVGAVVDGGRTEVVHGMPYNFKVKPKSVADMVSVLVNGELVANNTTLANVEIPSVNEDLEVIIRVSPLNTNAYTTIETSAGKLASLLGNAAPANLKLVGTMSPSDFDAIRNNTTRINNLDLGDVSIVSNSLDENNTLPSYAFVAKGNAIVGSSIASVVLPSKLGGIQTQAFYKCSNITQLTIPASVDFMNVDAFIGCTKLAKLTALRPEPLNLKWGNPFDASRQGSIELVVDDASKTPYSVATYWSMFKQNVILHNIQLDQTRNFPYNTATILTAIPNITKKYSIGCPNANVGSPSDNLKNNCQMPGVAFKLYHNGADKTADCQLRVIGGATTGGQYLLPITVASTPQNHIVKVVFYYNLAWNKPSSINVKEVSASKWTSVPMNYFVANSVARPTLFEEGSTYRFSLDGAPEGLQPKVTAISKVCIKPGTAANKQPQYVNTPVEVYGPDENGVYTLENLRGDTNFDITLVPANGTTLSATDVASLEKADVEHLTEVAIEGEVNDATLQAIRDNFSKLEVLDLSGVTNSEIPADAFKGMAALKTVSIPEGVTTIGAGAFSGCSSIQVLTLNGVTSIGDGAFNGCSAMTSLTLNSDEAAPRRVRAARRAPITGSSLSGLNPNCYVMVTNQELAQSLAGQGNIIYNGSGQRVAMSNINIDKAYPYNAPEAFTLGDKTISYTTEIGGAHSSSSEGWTGIILPFQPTDITDAGVPCPVQEKTVGYLSIATFNRVQDLGFSYQAVMKANTPYFARVNTMGQRLADTHTLTFTGSGADYTVPYTPASEELSTAGRQHKLYGVFSETPAEEDFFTVNPEGSAVALKDAEDGTPAVAVKPFAVYARPTGDVYEPVLLITPSVTTGTDEVKATEDSLLFSRQGQLLSIISSAPRTLDIYSVDGKLVGSYILVAGENTIDLPMGIYIVAGSKIKI